MKKRRLIIGHVVSVVNVLFETDQSIVIYHHDSYGVCDKYDYRYFACEKMEDDFVFNILGFWELWEYFLYPKSINASVLTFLFLKPIVGKDVARIIAQMLYKSRYDFVWEPTFELK